MATAKAGTVGVAESFLELGAEVGTQDEPSGRGDTTRSSYGPARAAATLPPSARFATQFTTQSVGAALATWPKFRLLPAAQ